MLKIPVIFQSCAVLWENLKGAQCTEIKCICSLLKTSMIPYSRPRGKARCEKPRGNARAKPCFLIYNPGKKSLGQYKHNSSLMWITSNVRKSRATHEKIINSSPIPTQFRFQILYFVLHYFKRLIKQIQYITKVRENKTKNYINYQRWKECSDQRSLGFRVGHCHVQLTCIDI